MLLEDVILVALMEMVRILDFGNQWNFKKGLDFKPSLMYI
jgi:hypothetical protein